MKRLIPCLAVLLSFCGAGAEGAADIKTETIVYSDGDVKLEGFLAYAPKKENEISGRPGILIIHQWKGLTDYEKGRAKQLARLGYVAFALDIYGQGVRPKDNAEAAREAGKFKGDRDLLRRRARAGLQVLSQNGLINPAKIAAIGYCFGGTSVLELARDSANIRGVVSFHGGLDAPRRANKGDILCNVMIMHGADDPHVPVGDIAATQSELREAGVDWQFVSFGGAVHSFTQKMAGDDPSKGAAYNEKADLRSWEMTLGFFDELFE